MYDLSFYIVRDDGVAKCHTDVARSTYFAISIFEIMRLMEKAGFMGFDVSIMFSVSLSQWAFDQVETNLARITLNVFEKSRQ